MSDDDVERMTISPVLGLSMFMDGVVSVRVPHVSSDREYLAALGLVCMRHAHLEHSLRLALKTLTGIDVAVLLVKKRRTGVGQIREEIEDEAAKKGAAVEARVKDYMKKFEALSTTRNEAVHGVCFRNDTNGTPFLLVDGNRAIRVPTPAELLTLADAIRALTKQFEDDRATGFS